jgi:hypothetical protein
MHLGGLACHFSFNYEMGKMSNLISGTLVRIYIAGACDIYCVAG